MINQVLIFYVVVGFILITAYYISVDLLTYLIWSRYTSENYQVMNYGVGGFISLHVDEHALPSPASTGLGKSITRYNSFMND